MKETVICECLFVYEGIRINDKGLCMIMCIITVNELGTVPNQSYSFLVVWLEYYTNHIGPKMHSYIVLLL